MEETKHKPYAERSDIEKIESNWRKLGGLLERREWLAAVVRAATVAEIAANLAIRHELRETRGLETRFVNHLLKWANGLWAKLNQILSRLDLREERAQLISDLKNAAQDISERRNEVVHSGHFMNEAEARQVVAIAKDFVERLVGAHHQGFTLQDPASGVDDRSERRGR